METRKVVLCFPPSCVEEPVTYHLIKDHGLKVNILRAAIDPGKQGRMVVEISGDNRQVSQGFNYLEQSGVLVEPLTQEIRLIEKQCTSCTACVPVCPTEALEEDPDTWKVRYDPEKCVVCFSCVDACPYRAIVTYSE